MVQSLRPAVVVSYLLPPPIDTRVVVAVQQEDGSRVQGEFSPGTALWEVLTEVGVAAREGEREPLVVYMGHKVL